MGNFSTSQNSGCISLVFLQLFFLLSFLPLSLCSGLLSFVRTFVRTDHNRSADPRNKIWKPRKDEFEYLLTLLLKPLELSQKCQVLYYFRFMVHSCLLEYSVGTFWAWARVPKVSQSAGIAISCDFLQAVVVS